MRPFQQAATLLLLHLVAALSIDHDGTHLNSTLEVSNAAQDVISRDTAFETAPALAKSGLLNHEKRKHRLEAQPETHPMEKRWKRPEFLTPEQQENKDLYDRMYHKDDEYAKWAKNPDLGRGKYWSRAFVLTLYKNRNRVVADRGVGLGKAWMSDEHGFIREQSDVIEKLPLALKQKYGFAPRHNRRLPPRPDRSGDPSMTADPPPPMSTARPALSADNTSKILSSEELRNEIRSLINQMGDFPASNVTETLTVNGVPFAVVSTLESPSAASSSPFIATVDGLPLAVVSVVDTTTSAEPGSSIIPISGTPLALVTEATATLTIQDNAVVKNTAKVKPQPGKPANFTSSLAAFVPGPARVHARDLNQEISKRAIPAILPELAQLLSPQFQTTLMGRAMLQGFTSQVLSGAQTLEAASEFISDINADFTANFANSAFREMTERVILEGAEYILPEFSIGGPAIAQGATVADGAVVQGGVAIAEGATIADGATIAEGAVIGKGATIAEGAIIGKGATIAEGALVSEGITIAEGASFGAEGAALTGGTIAEGAAAAAAGGEAAAIGATEGAIDAAAAAGTAAGTTAGTQTSILRTGALALLPLQEMLVIGQIVSAVVLLITIIGTIMMALMGKKKHIKNPDGKLEWAWDWDGRPYQVDYRHPPIHQGPRPTPTPPPWGCDTFDMPSLKDRGWTTTQYAMHPCPTWVPEECTREWYDDYRKDPDKGGDTVKGGNKDSRHNPNYCFEFWGFRPDGNKRFRNDNPAAAYAEALNKSYVAEFAQYSGHELALREQCLGSGKHGKERLQHNARCRKKFMPLMRHHNLRTENCQPEQCELQADKWRYLTSGWPKDCDGHKGDNPYCWALWGNLGHPKRSVDQDMHANSSMEPTPTIGE